MLTPPIPILLPLAVAALLAAFRGWLPRAAATTLAIAASLGVVCVAVSLIVYSRDAAMVVYWLLGWNGQGGEPRGFDLVIDNSAAMLVLLAGIVVSMAMLFAYRAVESAGASFHAFLLLLLAGAAGVSFAGDLLTLLLFFLLMSVAAFFLCARRRILARTHGIAAALFLAGIIVLLIRTGDANMAAVGRVAATAADPFVLAAFALILCGLLILAGAVPFHFWIADAMAHCTAPAAAAICGVMLPMALYSIARIYWVVFSGALQPYEIGVAGVLAIFGAATVLFGAVRCFPEQDLKRLLAYSAIAHSGMLLPALTMDGPSALAGVELHVMGYAMLHGGLYLAGGMLLYRAGTVQETELYARNRRLRWLAVLFMLGAAGLAGLPPFTTFWGDVMLNRFPWISALVFLAEALTAAAVLRFALRVFPGWGVAPPGHAAVHRRHRHIPASLYIAGSVLILLAALNGLAPRLTGAATSAAYYMQDRTGYAQRVLDLLTPYPPTVQDTAADPADLLRAFAAAGFACLLAWLWISPLVRRGVSGWTHFHGTPGAARLR